MLFIEWVVLGIVAGFVASKIVNKRGAGMILEITLGVLGAILGGILFTKFDAVFGAAAVANFNIYSILLAVAGAIIILLIYHATVGRDRSTL